MRRRSYPEGDRVIKVSIEIRSGTTRFRASVWAKSIERALSLVRTRYPGGEAKVIFPIEPESFFVVDAMPASVEVVRIDSPEEIAG